MNITLILSAALVFTSVNASALEVDTASFSVKTNTLTVLQRYRITNGGGFDFAMGGFGSVSATSQGQTQSKKNAPVHFSMMLSDMNSAPTPSPKQFLLQSQLMECARLAAASASPTDHTGDKREFNLTIETDHAIWPLAVGGFDGSSIIVMSPASKYGLVSVLCFTSAN